MGPRPIHEADLQPGRPLQRRPGRRWRLPGPLREAGEQRRRRRHSEARASPVPSPPRPQSGPGLGGVCGSLPGLAQSARSAPRPGHRRRGEEAAGGREVGAGRSEPGQRPDMETRYNLKSPGEQGWRRWAAPSKWTGVTPDSGARRCGPLTTRSSTPGFAVYARPPPAGVVQAAGQSGRRGRGTGCQA